MDHSVVYWLDIIANCFRRKLSKPYFIELNAGHPRALTKYLVSALAVASGYADCVILSTYESRIAELKHEMVANEETWKFFRERECSGMLDLLRRWKKEWGRYSSVLCSLK